MRDLKDLEESLLITALEVLRDHISNDSCGWEDEEIETVDNLLDELCRKRYSLDEPDTLH